MWVFPLRCAPYFLQNHFPRVITTKNRGHTVRAPLTFEWKKYGAHLTGRFMQQQTTSRNKQTASTSQPANQAGSNEQQATSKASHQAGNLAQEREAGSRRSGRQQQQEAATATATGQMHSRSCSYNRKLAASSAAAGNQQTGALSSAAMDKPTVPAASLQHW